MTEIQKNGCQTRSCPFKLKLKTVTEVKNMIDSNCVAGLSDPSVIVVNANLYTVFA